MTPPCPPCLDLICDFPPDLAVGGGIFATTSFTFVIACPPGFFCFGIQVVVVNPPPVVQPPPTGNDIILRLQGCLSEIIRILPSTATQQQINDAAASMQAEWAGQQATCFGIGNPPPQPPVTPPTPPLPPPRAIPPTVIDISGAPSQACVGIGYSASLSAFGSPAGNPPFVWQIISGSLPAGLVGATQTNTKEFIISGTPTVTGNFTILVRVTDALGNFNQRAFTIQVLGITNTPPAAQVGVAYNFQLTAAGASSPYTFTLSTGSLPTGLTLSSSGLISGTPTVAGTSSFTICVTGS
jgi:hypothetical protein